MAKGKSPSPAKAPSPAPIKSALRQAGEGGITRKELGNIIETSGKPGSTVIQRLDQLNQGLKERDKTGISLNSGAANMLIREAQKQPQYTPYFGAPSKFGTGPIGKAVQTSIGTIATPFNPAVAGTGLRVLGQTIRPGGATANIGFGTQYTLPTNTVGNTVLETKTGRGGENGPPRIPGNLGSTGTTGITGITDTGTTDTGTTGPEEGGPMTPQQKAEASSLAMGADINSSTLGYRRRQGSRARAGRSAQGLASQRVNPFGAWKGNKG